MIRRKKTHREGNPRLFLDGDQPTIYKKRRIRWKAIVLWSALGLITVLIIMFVWAVFWIKAKEADMRQNIPGSAVVLDTLADERGGQPETTLVIGIDKGSVPGEEDISRADILMLVSVSADGKKASVTSIPRDTRLMIPGHESYSKINAAYAMGGAPLMIETVEDFTGLEINHVVVLDFEGFKHIVDAIGGVPMHIDVAIHDKYAGDVPAGDVLLNGDQSLAFVRARHDVNAVPGGDLDRVENQRDFMKALLSAIAGQRNPFKIKHIIDVVAANIGTDLTFGDMYSLGRRLRGGEGVVMSTAPGTPRVIDGVWYYIVDEEAFQQMLADFEGTDDDTGEVVHGRSDISVKVLNGTEVTGLASSVTEELNQLGYLSVTNGNADNSYSNTTIYYGDGSSKEAETVAADLEGASNPTIKCNEELVEDNEVDVVVVLGSDYRAPGS